MLLKHLPETTVVRLQPSLPPEIILITLMHCWSKKQEKKELFLLLGSGVPPAVSKDDSGGKFVSQVENTFSDVRGI